jgi:hypothetical protein
MCVYQTAAAACQGRHLYILDIHSKAMLQDSHSYDEQAIFPARLKRHSLFCTTFVIMISGAEAQHPKLVHRRVLLQEQQPQAADLTTPIPAAADAAPAAVPEVTGPAATDQQLALVQSSEPTTTPAAADPSVALLPSAATSAATPETTAAPQQPPVAAQTTQAQGTPSVPTDPSTTQIDAQAVKQGTDVPATLMGGNSGELQLIDDPS